MNRRAKLNRAAQWLVVLLVAFLVKRFYAAAGADQLRWILTPTTTLVELVNGGGFEFEAGAGYLSRERNFLIAPSCAGVNFLLTAFLMLSLSKLVRERARPITWRFFLFAVLLAYVTTLVANTARITLALQFSQLSQVIPWFNAAQLHRLEGILIYFGFLLLLYVLSEKAGAAQAAKPLLRAWVPLLVYYTVMLGIPLANPHTWFSLNFREHAVFVLLVPLGLLLPLIACRYFQQKRILTAACDFRIPERG